MSYVQLDGARLWYEEMGDGPGVVLVHSGLGDSRMWDAHAPRLAERFRVVRYDIRFFGRSTAPDEDFSAVEDLARLLDELSLDRVALVGMSFGGRIAIDFTLTYPGRVSALVAVAAGLSGFHIAPYAEEREAAIGAAVEGGDLERSVELELETWAPLGLGDRVGELALANASVNGVEAEIHWAEPPAVERLGEIRVPTLIVTGDRDIPPMSEIGDLLEREIPSARRVVVEGADHFVPLRRPDDFTRIVADFLAGAL